MNEQDSLLTEARNGDTKALQSLFEVVQPALFRYLYRMIANREDAQDLLQECWIRAQKAISGFRGDASSLKSWWFGIAANLALDQLRQRKRWRVEAQLIAEQTTDSDPEALNKLVAITSDPEFRYEIAEHIAFCFTCIGKTLDPVEQSVILLREILGLSNEEAARAMNLSEPAFRHKLAAARQHMIRSYDGLCQLINKTGRCYQCVTLRELIPEENQGTLLTCIEPASEAPNTALAEALLDERLHIIRAADLEHGTTAPLHNVFFRSISRQEEKNAET